MENPKQTPLLLLAYLGDAVLETLVREYLIGICQNSRECNAAALDFVTAKAQSQAAKEMLPLLTEEEKELFTRAKNAKSPSVPRNIDLYSYRLATGVEALFGYWHLSGNRVRAREIFQLAFLKKDKQSAAEDEQLY